MLGESYTPITIAIDISQADSYKPHSYASLNSTFNPKNSEHRNFGGAGIFLFGGLIGLLIGWGIGYGSKSQASLEIQTSQNKKEMDTVGLGTVLDEKEKTSSDKNIVGLLDENNRLVLNEKTSKHIAEALYRGLDDTEADLYAINQLMEEEGYTSKGKSRKITEKELHALLKEYNKSEERVYDGKNTEEEINDERNPDSETVGETNLEAEVRNAEATDEAETNPDEADPDSEEAASEGEGE